MTDKILLKNQIAEVVGMSLVTVWREQKAGRFPHFDRISAGRVGLRQSVLAQWIEGRRDWSERAK
jgi:prophage regulatory protein